MNQARVAVFVAAAAGLAALVVWGFTGLPSFGHYPGPYGDQVVPRALHDRHATNAVTTVVMDIRAVDTAGEELILLASVVGVLMLLRAQRDEQDEPHPSESDAVDRRDPSGPARVASSILVAPVALFGIYIVVHGAVTPGGGFQGGVVLAAPSILVLLAAQRRSFDRLHDPLPWEIGQSVAVTAFFVVGFAGLAASARAFLANFLPRGSAGTVYSAGTITVLNLFAGVAVATAIVLLAVEYRHQATGVKRR